MDDGVDGDPDRLHVLTMIESAQRAGRSEREIVAMVEREVAQVDELAERRQRLQQRTSRDAA